MGIRGVGVDMVAIARISRLVECSRLGPRFMRKAFHSEEIAQGQSISSPSRRAQYFAGRWAAKEAAMKAVGTRILFPEILVARKPNSPPVIEFLGSAKVAAGASKAHLSISHETEYAVAYVILEQD